MGERRPAGATGRGRAARFVAVAVAALFGAVLVPQALAGTITVTSNADSGAGSLRDAITQANAAPAPAEIDFAIGSGLVTIAPFTPLPPITKPVVINGLSQPGIDPPDIVLDGSGCANGGSPCDGLVVQAGSSTIEGLAVVGFSGRGVVFDGSETGNGGNTLESSYIGWDPNTSFFHGSDDTGVAIVSSPDNTIGGPSPEAAVIVAGNGHGEGSQTEVLITGSTSSGNVVTGSWIGLGADRTSSADSANGIVITGGAHENTVGGAQAAGNTLYAFYQDGIDVRDAGSGNVIAGNSIGLDADGGMNAHSDTGIGVEGSPNTVIGDGAVPPQYADTARGNVVVGATGDVGIYITGSSGGTSLAGNFIGTDREGDAGLGNGDGVRTLSVTGGVTIGPGNTIAGNLGDGVQISGGSSQRVVANSIHGNGIGDGGGKGIHVYPGANDDIVPPSIADASTLGGTTTGHGTFQGAPSQTVWVELFNSPSCDPNGGGDTYLGAVTATADGNGKAVFSFSIGTGTGTAFVTATATDTSSADTSEFSNCLASSNGAAGLGTLVGDVVQDPGGSSPDEYPVDLSATGSEDWAIWGYAGDGTSTSLVPDERKANGSAISKLTNIDPDPSVPLRGLGQFNCGNPTCPPFLFGWSDGQSQASAESVRGGIQHDGEQIGTSTLGKGFAFDVPADPTTRTLKVYVSTNRADGELTATLSDESAENYVNTLPQAVDMRSAIYTITYAAASAGQTLHVQWVETADNCDPAYSCDNAALYAVALSGGGTATGATADLTSAASVGISGSNDKLADIPLRAFEPASNGTTPAPINGLPINGLPINGLPINGLPINGLPINGLPINGLPINGLPINGLPINGLPINGLPINGLPINGLELAQGWADILAGTTLEGVPLQTITLQDVLRLAPQPAAVEHLTLGQLEVADSALGRLTIGALALGATPINGLGLDQPSLDALLAWCKSTVPAADAANCSTASIGNASLFALGLAGAPINGLPINGLPINGLPINGLPINGLPINGLNLSASPINGLPINGLPINGLDKIVDCTSFDCSKTLGEAAAAGAIKPAATILDLLNVLLEAGSPVQDTLTLGDVLGLLIQRADVPWETLSPRLLSAFDPTRPTLQMTAGFTVQGTGQAAVTVEVALPDGFDFDPGSAQLVVPGTDNQSLPDPTVDGSTISWTLPGLNLGTPYSIEFGVRSGTTVGPTQATETVTSGNVSHSSIASFEVTDSFEPNGTAATARTIAPDQNVEMSAIAKSGTVDYYQVTLPAAGTRLQVHLTNLAADYDLALYSNRTTSVRTAPTDGAPLQDGVIADQSLNLEGGPNAQLTPTALQDVPDPGIPVVQVSANRGTDDEDVGMVSPGGGTATIAVFGYNGASSPQPYTLRVTTQAPQQLTCPARTFAGGGTAGAAPAVSSLPGNLNTLILVDEKRIGDTYGSGAESDVVTALDHLAGDGSLGVSGAVIPVEGLAQAQYTAWDTNPCSVDAANAVANAIADEIDAVKAARPTLKYVVFAGGDDQIPFFRIPDLSRIANETGFAGQFGQNEYYGALAGGDLLTDNPYLDTRPIPASGRQLFVPDLVGGRLVEKPSQIVDAVSRFETSNGTLRSSTAFVSGYDFITDGSQLVQSRLASILGSGNVRALISDTWSKSTLLGALGAFPSGGPAAINDWNGHYDNYQALAADGDQSNLLSAADLTGSDALSGGIFFTMGCHAGFQTTDAIVGTSAADKLDWAEYFAGTGTGFVGNTGFGLGNTDSVAFSEELMADLAGHLDGSISIGEALAQAKRDYYLSRTAFSSYDEKTLSEAELYGLPMYGVGSAPAALAATPLATVSPDPVPGSTSSTSPSEGSLHPLAGTSADVAAFDAVPLFSSLQTGAHGQYFTNAGQMQAPNYRPLQPYLTLPATRSGSRAHGVLIDGLTSDDHTPFDPDNVRPTLDLSAHEPEPQFDEEAWPTKVPTLVTLDDANGLQQSLDLTTGQFFTDDTSHQGVERLWTHIGGRVTYSPSADFVPPTIDSIDAYLSNGVVAFTGTFSDLDQNGNAGTVALAQVVYDVDNSGTWVSLPLQQQSGGAWTGGVSFSGTHVQFFVEACDTAGNCGFSSNKGRYFDAQPLPSQGTGTVTLTPDRGPDAQPWYKSSLTVTVATSGTGTVTVSVDGGPFQPATGPVTLSGDGAHVVDARSSDGSEATAVFLIDGRGPQVTPAVNPDPPDGTNGWYTTAPLVTFTCTDDLSGVAPGACLIDGGTSNHVTLGQGASPQSVSASATDNAGNTGSGSISGLKVDLTDPAVPVFHGIQDGQHYSLPDLPPASAISCSSSDAISGLAGCVVSGYSATAGAHVLTATATDNAGRTKTSTLTYTVVASSLDGKILISRRFRIWLLDPSSGAASRLSGSSGPYDDEPARSPDGKKVIFARRTRSLGSSQLWVMNADGTGAKQLTTTSGDSSNPRWSRDGSQVAFQSTRPGSKGYDVWIATWNPATSTLSGYQNLTDASGNDIGPTFSPSGTGKIAFASDRLHGQFDIYTMTTSGGGPTRITTDPRTDFDPAWSPGGTQIAFSSNRAAGIGSFEIYLMNADGSGTRRLTTQFGVQREPYWFTSTRLDFTSDKLFGGGIATLDLSTSQPPTRVSGSRLGDSSPG